jgi:L-threonylcarbamoyladenylate synthase
MALIAVDEAAARLAAGALVAFPTETVYGLGARADDEAAVAAIFAAKGRPSDHPLIVHVADVDAATRFASRLGDDFERLTRAFWPGPLTLIVPRRAGMATAAAGGQDSIGLRLPAHPLAQALLRACAALGVPGLAGPSANRFGRVSPTCAAHVLDEFGATVPVLDGGPCAVGIESTIVDLSREQPTLLRPGQLGRDVIEACLGRPLAERSAASPRASGTLEAHYAPSAPVRLLGGDDLRSAMAAAMDRGSWTGPDGLPGRLAVYSRCSWDRPDLQALARAGVLWRRMSDDAATAAHELFAALRELDATGPQQIWVEAPPEGPSWEGVRDRLRRAAAAAA